MKNSIDLYNRNKPLYERWPCRKKMILEIFPKMKGSVLNVGVHDFNRHDGICFVNKELYTTIDLIEKNKQYGSKNHIVGDILNVTKKYNNIILFGVLNIPNIEHVELKNPANYSLYKKENILIKKLDDILEKNGEVLFGPDIPKSTLENSKITENYYDDFFLKNEIIQKKFIQTMKFIGRGNIIYIYKKIV